MKCPPDILETTYHDKLRLVFLREWARVVLGEAALLEFDDSLRAGAVPKVDPAVDADIEAVITAMATGKVIPGLWYSSDGKCFQDWTVTACFARHYMQQMLGKAKIQQALASGDTTVLEDKAMSPCQVGPMTANCCPTSVWADPAYLNMDREVSKPSTSWWKLGAIALGLGLTAAWIKAKL